MQDPVIVLSPDLGTMSITLVAFGALVAIPIYFVVRFLRAYERRSKPVPNVQSQAATIVSLQDEVDALRVEVEQLTEVQDFTAQLLHERPSGDLNSVRKGAPVHNDDESKR